MTEQRLIQNFRKSRGLLWVGPDFSPESLERSLQRLGVSVSRVDQIDPTGLDGDRDVIFLDADQPIDPTPLRQPGTNVFAAPVIGLVGVEAPSRLKLLMEAGATALIRKPVQSANVYSAMFLGVNNYRRLRSAEARLAIVDRKRRGRRFLIKAIVALIQTHAMGDDDAYAALRRESMRRRLDLEEFCESLFQPGTDFPVTWPGDLTPVGQSPEQGRSPHAKDVDDGRCAGGADGAFGHKGGRADQARRA